MRRLSVKYQCFQLLMIHCLFALSYLIFDWLSLMSRIAFLNCHHFLDAICYLGHCCIVDCYFKMNVLGGLVFILIVFHPKTSSPSGLLSFGCHLINSGFISVSKLYCLDLNVKINKDGMANDNSDIFSSESPALFVMQSVYCLLCCVIFIFS